MANQDLKKKPKIAFVISSLTSGGAERVVSVLCNSLCKDYQVTLIMLTEMIPFYKINKEVDIIPCKKEPNHENGSIRSIYSKYLLVKKIARILRSKEIQVAIGFMRTSNILTILAAKYLGIPVLVSERNHPVVIDRSQSKLWKLLMRLTYPRANKLVVQTELIKDYYNKFVPENKLEIIPNPINPDFESLSNGRSENIILSVGSLIPQKAQHHLINAFAKIAPGNWSLKIFGEGARREELEHLIRSHGMSDKIDLPGRSQKIETVYQSAKIFVLTSNYEGFPNVLLEAMHFGLACISTDCPSGPGDILEDGVNGFLIPVGDEKALEKNLSILIEDKELRQSFSEKAKETSKYYSISRIKDYWVNLIDQELNT